MPIPSSPNCTSPSNLNLTKFNKESFKSGWLVPSAFCIKNYLQQLHKMLCLKQQGLKFTARQKQILSSNKNFKYLSRINHSYGNL